MKKEKKRTGIKTFREQKIIDVLKLKADKVESIIGVDAIDNKGNKFEIKTTTIDQFSLAKNVYFTHTKKWKDLNWIFVTGKTPSNNHFDIDEVYLVTRHNKDMQKVIESMEEKIRKENVLFSKIVSLINENLYNKDLFTVSEILELKNFKNKVMRLPSVKIQKSFIQKIGHKLSYPYDADLKEKIYKHDY